MRRADAYTYSYSRGNRYGYADSDAYADFNAYSYSYGYGYAHGDTYTDGDAYSGNANTDGDADVRAWGHTWAVEHGCTRTECSIPRWWNDRWNLLLRLRWPNLHRRLPK